MTSIRFMNGAVPIAGSLHLPDDFDAAARYPALVCTHPGNGVKEQTAANYASRMATRGFVALAFDASGQGASGGEPRGGEDPATRVEDIRCAVDYLTTCDFVDEQRIGGLGICAGGGYTVNAAMTDHRIAAIGVVAPINIGRARREGAGGTPERLDDLLREIGRQRTLQARTGETLTQPWLPDSHEAAERAGIEDMDTLEAIDYYRTPRGAHPRSTNVLRSTTVAAVIGFDAFHLLEELLTQPLQVIVGNRVGSFGSYRDGYELWRRTTHPKDLLVIDGASHYDLYDVPRYLEQAVDRLDVFFTTHLHRAHSTTEVSLSASHSTGCRLNATMEPRE